MPEDNRYHQAYLTYITNKNKISKTYPNTLNQSYAYYIQTQGASPNMFLTKINNSPVVQLSNYKTHYNNVKEALYALDNIGENVGEILTKLTALDNALSNFYNSLNAAGKSTIESLKENTFVKTLRNLCKQCEDLTKQLAANPSLKSATRLKFVTRGVNVNGKKRISIPAYQEYINSHNFKTDLATFAESMAGAALQTEVGEQLMSYNVLKEIKNTLRSKQTGIIAGTSDDPLKTSLEEISVNESIPINKKEWEIDFGRNLTDIKISPDGGSVTFNFSQKQYLPTKAATQKFKALTTDTRRLLLYLLSNGGITMDGYWGIVRALAYPPTNPPQLTTAFKRDFWVQAIFGEEEDLITDFLLNGNLIPGSTIYEYLEQSINTSKSAVKLTISRYAPSQSDKYAARRTSEEESSYYYLDYAAAKIASTRHLEFHFEIPAAWYNL